MAVTPPNEIAAGPGLAPMIRNGGIKAGPPLPHGVWETHSVSLPPLKSTRIGPSQRSSEPQACRNNCSAISKGNVVMETRIDRRQLLKTGAAASFVAGSQFFMGVPALADYAVGPTVRRNASPMAANDPILRGYRRAIRAMRAASRHQSVQLVLPGRDPRHHQLAQSSVVEHVPHQPKFLLGVAPHVPLLLRADRAETCAACTIGPFPIGTGQIPPSARFPPRSAIVTDACCSMPPATRA